MITYEALTPADYKKFSGTFEISYGFYYTPFGLVLIALTKQGVCHLSFVDRNRDDALKELQKQWRGALLSEDREKITALGTTIFQENNQPGNISVHLFLKGTPFQIKVWVALLAVPYGTCARYFDIAHAIEQPGAIRAAASAVARNYISYLIPCHRIVRSSGEIGNYRWGKERKKALIEYEERTRK